jgi:hypothetical protein
MAQPTEQEKRMGWNNLSPERKRQLEMGGGLVAGLGLLGGGYAMHRHHEKNEEEKKADAWAMSNWHDDAQKRTQQFYNNGPQAPFTWVLTEGDQIPDNAFQGGQDGDGSPLYIARAYYDNGLQIGKAGRHLGGAVISYAGKEVQVPKYEVLMCDPSRVRWVDGSQFRQGGRPVEGGREEDGTPLSIAQAFHEGGTHPGKFSDKLGRAYIPWGGKELGVDQFRILCFN